MSLAISTNNRPETPPGLPDLRLAALLRQEAPVDTTQAGAAVALDAGKSRQVAAQPPGTRFHGYTGGLMGHSELTWATAVSADVTVGPVTFYAARISPQGHPPEDFYTVSTTEAPKFLKAVADKLRSAGNVGAAHVLDQRIKVAEYILAKGIQANADAARRGGPHHGGDHAHGGIGLDAGLYIYGPAGAEGRGAKVLMQAFADWKQGKPIHLEGLDDVGFGMYATPTAGVHRDIGKIFQAGAHGLWGAFAGFRFGDNHMKREFFTVGEGAAGVGAGPVQVSAGALYFRSFDAPENAKYKTNPFDVISVTDPVSGQEVATQVPTAGVDGALWNAAFMWNGVQKDPKVRQQQFKGTNPIHQIRPMSYPAFKVYTDLKQALETPQFRSEFQRAPDYYLAHMFAGYSRDSIREAMSTLSWERSTGLDYKRAFAVPQPGGGH